MKNLLILGTIFLITACSQSETDKLISDQKKLEKQIIELNKQAEPLGDECNKYPAKNPFIAIPIPVAIIAEDTKGKK